MVDQGTPDTLQNREWRNAIHRNRFPTAQFWNHPGTKGLPKRTSMGDGQNTKKECAYCPFETRKLQWWRLHIIRKILTKLKHLGTGGSTRRKGERNNPYSVKHKLRIVCPHIKEPGKITWVWPRRGKFQGGYLPEKNTKFLKARETIRRS